MQTSASYTDQYMSVIREKNYIDDDPWKSVLMVWYSTHLLRLLMHVCAMKTTVRVNLNKARLGPAGKFETREFRGHNVLFAQVENFYSKFEI